MAKTTLEFEGPSFTDADLRAIRRLDKVKSLGLWNTAVTDDGCRELARARALDEISILSDILSGRVLEILAQLPALRSLQIHHGPLIGDDGARSLAECTGLRELYLNETAITDQSLAAIGSLRDLWSLALDDTSVSDAGCEALSGMPRLSLLLLNRTRVTGAGLASLPNNDHFHLHLDQTPVTDAGVIALAERLSNLKLISLGQTNVGDAAARALAKLPRLNVVLFSETKVTDDGLSAFSGHPSLEQIDVEGCAVSKSAVDALKASVRRLTVYGP